MNWNYMIGCLAAGIVLAWIGDAFELPFWSVAIAALVFGWYLGGQQRKAERRGNSLSDKT